jgi:hypothetical protein
MDDESGAAQRVIALARGYVTDATWIYARTMPDNPHWYTVITRATDHRIDALLTLLLRYAHVRRWHGQPFRTISLDGWDYWDIDPVVNRKPTEFAGWDGDPPPPDGWLPDAYRRDMSGDEQIELRRPHG